MKLKENMNKENYVSLKVAKLLKEKGYDYPTIYYYESNGNVGMMSLEEQMRKHGYMSDVYPMPSLYKAAKWLREKHMIYVSSLPTKDNGTTVWYFQIVKDAFDDGIYSRVFPSTFNTYEEALNEGIKETIILNYI